jgi:lipopolysaccharide/colanic/teichoic acid biosynthesis glycosyltransferase
VFRTRTFLSFEYVNSSLSYVSAIPEFKKSKDEDDELNGFLWEYADLTSPSTTIVEPEGMNDFAASPDGFYNACIHLQKVNDLNGINNFLRTANSKLKEDGVLICCLETIEQRKERLFGDLSPVLFLPYNLTDFLWNRVAPKMSLTKKLYFALSKGSSRVISLTEMLGRLIYSGFRILKTKTINGKTYIAVRKEKEPVNDRPSSGGMILKMNRVGKHGKLFRIYKLRTMFTFSEYLQKYIYENNNLKSNGKFANDIRITGWGKFLRKYWLDELPMIINVLRGEMKIVGLRPLTQHYLSLYNENIAAIRSTIKPGLIPPFYCDMPETFEEIMASEEKYVKSYMKNPVKTDIVYFFKAFYNIVFNGARSS